MSRSWIKVRALAVTCWGRLSAPTTGVERRRCSRLAGIRKIVSPSVVYHHNGGRLGYGRKFVNAASRTCLDLHRLCINETWEQELSRRRSDGALAELIDTE